MKSSSTNRRRQRGVALLTVLLLVAVMTVLVIGVLDDIRFGLRRAGNAQTVAQAQWYALGAEALAQVQMQRLAQRDGGRTTLEGNWNDRPFLFPIGNGPFGSAGLSESADGEGGAISARVFDSTTCFNLNSVVEGAGEQWQRRDLGVEQFIALLRALEFSAAQAGSLADALVDWIDADQQRSARGAEDANYGAYRTAGTLLSEVSELRAVQGYGAEIYVRLRPYVCALPGAELSPVNINTLEREDGAIVSMLAGGTIGAAEGRRVILARPPDGWRDYAAFWGQPALSGVVVPNPVLNQIALRTRYFGLHAQVEYGGAQVVLSALFEQDAAGDTALVARRWSSDE